MTAQQIDAINKASDVLRTEANKLAEYLENTLKAKLTARLQDIADTGPVMPHRVAIAVHTEMARLRDISDVLLDMRTTDSDSEP